MYTQWETSPEAATAIPGALRLFNKAREAGVAVFFITGRGGIPDYSAATAAPDETDATARNLEAAGFHGWEGLQLRNGGERSMPTIDYKSEERRRIVLKGYRLIMSLGDQWSDLLGEPQADISIKLPNPFYFIP
jgi:predicted secreted acid phosphatase